MKLFSCPTCRQAIFFENVRCTQCGATLAYLPEHRTMAALMPREGYLEASLEAARGVRFRLCQNSIDYGVCNWAVQEKDADALCRGCRLNDVIPNLTHDGALTAWARIEHAKKRLLATLYDLGLPVESSRERPNGLLFSFKEQTDAGPPVFTGHQNGHITLNIAEADNPGRERLREQLGETYRTLLGHFRHEIGHYYWDVLVRDTPELAPFRTLFGDPDKSYADEQKRHYAEGPPADWPSRYVSAYASMHPWEDWAETWAHYLHMVDTLGTARSYGLALRPLPTGVSRPPGTLQMSARQLDFDDFDDLLTGWVPLTLALNSLNRAMGLADPYPFVLSPPATEKLRFVHDVIERAARGSAPTP